MRVNIWKWKRQCKRGGFYLPAGSIAKPNGPFNSAPVAGPKSPVEPEVPLTPANILKITEGGRGE